MSTTQVLTSDYEYTNIPIRQRVTFKSLDGSDTYFTYSAFLTPSQNPLNIFYTDAERAMLETGSFNILVSDVDNIISKDRLRNTRVYIELGRTAATLETFLVGFADIFDVRRPRSFYQEYLIAGPSTKIQSAELMLLIRKATQKLNNPDYAVGNLIEESMEGNKWRPLNREDIQSLTKWNLGGINKPALNRLFFPKINEIMSTHWDFLDRMSALTGAPWDIDYSQATYPFTDKDTNEIFTMDFLGNEPTGVVIKSGDLKTPTDNGAHTAYILDQFEIEDNSSADANVSTRLYSINSIDQALISSSTVNAGSTTLVSRAIAQQLVIENDQRRITDLTLTLSKVGEPESPNDRVNGDLCMDGGNNTPTGRTLATFKIDLNDIKAEPGDIEINDLDVKVRFLQGENFIWIRLFQRSGTDGDPNNDNTKTIRWHHNGQLNTAQTFRSASSTNNGGDYKLRETMTWATSALGPTYTYQVKSNIRRLLARSNPTQARVLRTKESFLDTSWIQDPIAASRLMSIMLAQRSKARRTVPEFRVTNPIGLLFKPYMPVALNDGLSNTFQELQISRVRYVMSAIAGENPIGTDHADITLTGLFNSLIGNCSCQL